MFCVILAKEAGAEKGLAKAIDDKMIIDAHVNITHNGKWFNTSYDASLERLLREMDEADVGKCLLISMPFATTNKYIASVIERYPERFRGFGHIDFSGNLRHEVDEILSMGLSGVKIHPRMQGINCNATEFETLFKYLDEKGLTIMIDGYYQNRNDRVYLSELTPFNYDRLAKKYTNINIILSHMGGHRVLDAYFLAKSNGNVSLDVSHVLKYFDGTSLISDFLWVIDKLDEKILYGSDFPEYPIKSYLSHFEGIISQRLGIRKEMIYRNAGIFWDKHLYEL
ncbi:putative metal-dependent hydrolase of the TIM-barrel fold protein [Candidatus Magnetominusculus xianensis]|uniref:Metal-dependent hydrolase of the TIM-barrel fold protein n=1 Tax=Candidatus Magnetominusculus xianensis TaxID=1748249 RepID=A0ABR5SHI0_9BACT|nr:putative metal-dependent hydrolase of the TIM-barrel fold protein [Candidatus Magnetominusculus xianensis]